jgi:hypothetical protein
VKRVGGRETGITWIKRNQHLEEDACGSGFIGRFVISPNDGLNDTRFFKCCENTEEVETLQQIYDPSYQCSPICLGRSFIRSHTKFEV